MSTPRMHGHPIVHELKCSPGYFEDVKDGTKPYEVRLDDRPEGYHVEDYLWLREFDQQHGYTLDCLMCVVTHVLRGPCPDHGATLYEKAASGARLTDAEEACVYHGCHADKPFPGVAPGYVVMGVRVLS